MLICLQPCRKKSELVVVMQYQQEKNSVQFQLCSVSMLSDCGFWSQWFHEGCCLFRHKLELRHFRGLLENWNQMALDYQHLLHHQMSKTGCCRRLRSINLNRLIPMASKIHLLDQQIQPMRMQISLKHRGWKLSCSVNSCVKKMQLYGTSAFCAELKHRLCPSYQVLYIIHTTIIPFLNVDSMCWKP